METGDCGGSAFRVACANKVAALCFTDRTPEDPLRPIERYRVTLAIEGEVLGRVWVYGIAPQAHPGAFFTTMAAQWQAGFSECEWEAPGEECRLSAAIDRRGHVPVQITLRSGPSAADWVLQATLWTEAGQLETLAHDAVAFFGEEARPSCP